MFPGLLVRRAGGGRLSLWLISPFAVYLSADLRAGEQQPSPAIARAGHKDTKQ